MPSRAKGAVLIAGVVVGARSPTTPSAQGQASPQPGPAFRSGDEYVPLDVVVTDNTHKPITDRGRAPTIAVRFR